MNLRSMFPSFRKSTPHPNQQTGADSSIPERSITLMGGIGYVLALWRPYWRRGVVILGLLTLYLLYKTYFALVVRSLMDMLQRTGRIDNMPFLVGTLAAAFVVAFGARLVAERWIAAIAVKIVNDLRVRMFNHLQRLSQGFYLRTPLGDILSRFSSSPAELERAAGGKLRDGLVDCLEILYNLPVLIFLSWELAALELCLIGAMAYGISRLIPAATAAGYTVRNKEATLLGAVQESARAQALIRAFGFETQIFDRFRQHVDDVEQAGARAQILSTRVSLAAKSCIMAIRLTLTLVAAWMVMQNAITIGTLIAFLALTELIMGAADDLVRNILPDFIATTGSIQRIEDLLREQPDTVDHPDAVAIPPLAQEIVLDEVSFSYTGEAQNLSEITMRIAAGTSVAFVGPSGSGKSTLLSLLLRAHEPTAGSIRFDGVDLRQAQRSALQAQTGVVFQETYLFDTSVRENIRMARPDASNAEVEAAAQSAEIHELIMGLPQQYETRVGEAGGWLSGGQRQRVAIARAIIRNPALLVLDEATSALDPGTEAAINATLARLAQARTVIAVTHRLSSVVDADCVFVLEGGQLVEAGSHAELVAQDRVYAQLWQKQTGFHVSDDGRRGSVDAAYLRHVGLFSELDLETLGALAARFNPEYLGEGQTVFRQGEPGDKLYLIARGQVEVLVRPVNNTGQTTERRIDTMEDGDHFGDMALLDDAPRNATIRTLTGSLFLTLPKREFLELVRTLPAVRAAVDAQIERNLANRERQHVVTGA